jgi:hypothetical protein
MKEMKHISTIISAIIILTLINCKGQTINTDILYLKDFTFNTILGFNKHDKNTMYCILGQGYLRTPRSDNSDSLVKTWLTNHPNAIVLKVSTMAIPEENKPEMKMTYCLIIDGKDTLNNYLVRQGCYPGGTMQRPETWEEMSDREKEIYKDIKDKLNVIVQIDKKAYENFIEQIKTSEKYASDNKLGIWADDKTIQKNE